MENMDKLDIILWVLGGGFTIMFTLLGFLWKHMNSEFKTRFDKVDTRFDKVDTRFDKVEEKITDIDRRLCRWEGAFSAKECCAVKHINEAKVG